MYTTSTSNEQKVAGIGSHTLSILSEFLMLKETLLGCSGLFMAGQKKLVTSWWVAFYGAFCRFIVGPGAMGLASLLLGLRGDALRFAILQVCPLI